MRLSILVNNHNYAPFLARAIQSALDQTYRDTEIIVVDDGSTDESQQIIGQYGDAIKAIFKENGGQASCFNAGFEASSGDIICLLDSDDYFLPNKAAELAATYSSDIDIGWIFHSMNYENEEMQTIGKAIVSPSGRVDLRRRTRLGFVKQILPATSALTFRREILNSLLPMPEAPGVFLGDYYLKLGAISLAAGFQSEKVLAVQQIHRRNQYTGKSTPEMKAKIAIQTALALKDKLPVSEALCDNLVGTAQSFLADNEGSPISDLVAQYLKKSSLTGRMRVAFWRTLKTKRRGSTPAAQT